MTLTARRAHQRLLRQRLVYPGDTPVPGSERDWRQQMAKYLKVPDRDSFQVDHVALQLFRSADGARGSVNCPSRLNEGIPTTFEPDLLAPEARSARRTTPTSYRLTWRYSILIIFGKANGVNWSSPRHGQPTPPIRPADDARQHVRPLSDQFPPCDSRKAMILARSSGEAGRRRVSFCCRRLLGRDLQ
jgi:hypothetical protein